MSNVLHLIKESFETWYNTEIAKDSPVSVVVNYSDTQPYSIKAYHKASLDLQFIVIEGGVAHTQPIVSLAENYNHGVVSEEEAKDSMVKKLLVELYGFWS